MEIIGFLIILSSNKSDIKRRIKKTGNLSTACLSILFLILNSNRLVYLLDVSPCIRNPILSSL